MPTFKHPTVLTGQVTYAGEIYPIEDGVFEAPASVAAQVPGAKAYDATAVPMPASPGLDDKKGRRK